MTQADFQYRSVRTSSDSVRDTAGMASTLSIYADRAHVAEGLRDDAQAVGFKIGQVDNVGPLLAQQGAPLDDVILLDCPCPQGGVLAGLSRLDVQAADAGTQLIVSTSVEGLDGVFGCFDRSDTQLLVEPTRGERVIALGRALAKMPGMRLREISDDDRLTLIRLTEQVGQIAERLERMGTAGRGADGGAFRFESPGPEFKGQNTESNSADSSARLVRAKRPALPDPRLVRRIISQRQARAKFFDGNLFADPAWDMLLDLTAARAEHVRVSVTSLCIASGVPLTTALRWINQMVESGLLVRVEDEADKRRAFIALSDTGADGMARYFADIGKHAASLI